MMIVVFKKVRTFLIFVLLNVIVINGYGQKIGPWNLNDLNEVPKWEKTLKAQKEGMTGILYESLPNKGNKVQVFAYYNAPKGNMPKAGWPAVVCVHGGGGTAFNEWVKKWNDHGYAAISMDLEGHYPIKDTIEGKLQRVPTENPGIARVGTFMDFDLPIKEQWYYNAVAHIILANSLIRSFPEVDANKIGITGISWGGNLTSTVMGVDSRFKFAIPVYGCGFLPEADGAQGDAIKPGKHTAVVYENYDGSAYFKNVSIPTFWLNGTNDRHFSMLSTLKSSQSVKGPATLRYKKEMPHGHKVGWKPEEIYAFANSVVKNEVPLIHFDKPVVKKNNITVAIKTAKEVTKVELLYTKDLGAWNKRKWEVSEARLEKKKIKAIIPAGATTVYLTASDEDGFMVTSEFVVINQ
ncbi:S9 family peptidase [Ancylomarina sp. 16SWW S1-10-2]|uniref:alpha/beta hydrolase family protein n=1 Tax=Ancylomarina sp. 16SWW S1-10-2 TaxID=2499681 RepID=UPI0012AD8E01|nr:acetylxylan esterase [Ancylomarina sp. 16SWW S1-10-2]MRT93771.1 hypothetical protein [Ancylomarina sp. 16SWW S1-10-2]